MKEIAVRRKEGTQKAKETRKKNQGIFVLKASSLFNKPLSSLSVIIPRREKTSLRGFRPGLTQTRLYNHTKRLDAWNF